MAFGEAVPVSGSEVKLSFEPSERFRPATEYRDKPFAIMFLLHLVLFLGLFIFAAVYYANLPPYDTVTDADEWQRFILSLSTGDVFGVLGVLAACGVFGGLFAALWLWLIKQFTRIMIILSLLICTVMLVALGGFIIVLGALSDDSNTALVAYITGAIIVGLGLLSMLAYFFWRKKIPFTTLILQTVCHILDHQSGNFLVALGAMTVYFVWFILWAAACVLAQSISYWNEGVAVAILLFFLFSFFWTTETIKNTVHVTVSGAVASWYFKADDTPAQATIHSLKRATTTSFGSICFGSLLIAIVSFLRALAESPNSSNEHWVLILIKCCLRCFLVCLESLLRLFNKYAFTQVAIYGKDYLQAAKATWTLISYYGIDTILNDALVGNVLGLGIISGAFFTCFPAIAVVLLFDSTDPNVIFLQFFLGLFVGLGILTVCLNVVDSATATLFVCICEEPATLQRNFPELHAHMQQVYGQSNLFTTVHM